MSLEKILLKEIKFIEQNTKEKGSYIEKKYFFKRKNFNIELNYGIKHNIIILRYTTKNKNYNIKILYEKNKLLEQLEYKTTLEEKKAKKLLDLSKKILEKTITTKKLEEKLLEKIESKKNNQFYYGYDTINKEEFELFYTNTKNFRTTTYKSKKYHFTIEYHYKNNTYTYEGKIPINIQNILEREKPSKKNDIITYFITRTKRKIKKLKQLLE